MKRTDEKTSTLKRNSFVIALFLVCLLSALTLAGIVAYSLWADHQIANSPKFISAEEEIVEDSLSVDSLCDTSVVNAEESESSDATSSEEKKSDEEKDTSSDAKGEERGESAENNKKKDSTGNSSNESTSSSEGGAASKGSDSSSSGQGSSDQGSMGGSSTGGGSSQEKVWVEPVYETVHHEAVTETIVKYVCNDERNGYTCRAEYDSADDFYNLHKLPTGG